MSAPLRSRLPGVLVVDDEIRSQEAIRRTLEEDFEVFCASDAAAALALIEREMPGGIHIVLCDQRMPGLSGIEFLKQVRERWPDVVRIILSGYTDAEDIIDGVNGAGIYQYLTKPWQPEQLLLTLKNAASVWRLQQENQWLSLELRSAEPELKRKVADKAGRVRHQRGLDNIVRAPHSPLEALIGTVRKIAPYDISVLVQGESGSGKEMIARALHAQSSRADKAFVVENCGALPDQLLEAELFGYKRGAFTGAYEDRVGLFQMADGGTIFLDEIGETSPAFQVKLLRVLQEGEMRPLGSPRPVAVNVRVLAATNKDLETEVRAGRFRQDLYYRLATVTLAVPPLRERPMDIPLLAGKLLDAAQAQLGKSSDGFTREALACIASYPWPGNVRELRNEIVRMLAMSEGRQIGAELLSPRILRTPIGCGGNGADGHDGQENELAFLVGIEGSLKDRLEQLEMRVIKETLIRHRWNKSKAAQELGLSRVGLRLKLGRYGMEQQ